MRHVDWLQSFHKSPPCCAAPAQPQGGVFLNNFNCFKKYSRQLIHAPETWAILMSSFPWELLPEPFEVGEGPAPPMAGDVPAVRGSSVQGFPCRYYDRRVLDEHFERGLSSEGFPQGQPDLPRPPKRNGRDEKSPDGRSSDRIITTQKTRFDDRPSSQPFNGQTQKRAWQGESSRWAENPK